MEVLIVAKTRMKGGRICVGGLRLEDQQSLRLLPSMGHSHPQNTKLNIGDVWEFTLQAVSANEITAPHIEDIRIIRGRPIRSMRMPDLAEFLLRRVGAPKVQPAVLFHGRIRINKNHKAAITPNGGIPTFSTGFWRFDKPLHINLDDGKTRYVCFDEDDENWILDVPYVGVQEPVESIPPETVLRFSLGRWFKKNPGFWLQLSGWFL